MIRNLKLIITLIILGFVTNSCQFSGCEVKNISKSEQEWFDCYNEDQILTFKNQYGNIDTFIVQNIDTTYSPCNKFELGPNQYQKISISLKSNRLEKSRVFNGIQIIFEQSYDEDYCDKSFYMFDYKSYRNTNIDRYFDDSLLILNNLNKEEVHCFIFDSKHDDYYNTNDYGLRKFYWSKKNGLVKYIIQDSLEYELNSIN